MSDSRRTKPPPKGETVILGLSVAAAFTALRIGSLTLLVLAALAPMAVLLWMLLR